MQNGREGVLLRSGISILLLFAVFSFSGANTVSDASDGNLLKRSQEEMCHACHKTNVNTPSVIYGNPNPDWDSAIKTHSAETLGTCSNTVYKTMSECVDPLKGNGTWTSGKWTPGGWGVAGGQYGVFQCTTCHTAHDTQNIYLIKETISAPNSPTESFPGGPVDFRVKWGVPVSLGGGTPGLMGDDSRSTATNSTNVCEVCHSKNKYHNYDASKQSDMGHNNAADCSACHSHKNAFKGLGSCNSCHNAPPTAGGQKHLTHFGTGTASYGTSNIQSSTTAYGFSCGICHNGTHLNTGSNPRTVEVRFAGIATQDGATGAAFTPSAYTVDTPANSSYTFNYSDGTCSNVYCHGNYPGSGKKASPTFVSGTAPCGSCHEASNLVVPASASHSKHALSTDYNFSCTLCHNGIVGGTGPASYTIADKSRHVSGSVDWQFDQSDNRIILSPTASYSIQSGTKPPSDGTTSAYGTCSNLYCHSNANPATNSDSTKNVPNTYKTPTWGGNPPGSHMACYSCHKGRTSNSNVAVQQTEDNTQANCTALAAIDNAPYYWDSYCVTTQSLCQPSYTWGPDQLCRGANLTQSICESTSTGGLNGRWVQVCVNSQTDPTPVLTMNSNGHHRLVNPRWIRKYPCIYCHAATVDATGAVKDKTMHVNATKDIKIHTTQASAQGIKNWGIDGMGDPTYDSNTKVCSNIYCHSDGRENINFTIVTPAPWNGQSMQCNSCHGHPLGSCANSGCHDGQTVQSNNKVLPTLCSGITQDVCEANDGTWSGVFCQGLTGGLSDPTGGTKCTSLGGKVDWPAGSEWMAAAPMFPNGGPGSGSENSHPRHIQSNFACSICHNKTVSNGVCSTCHTGGVTPSGSMGETAHVNATYHVNKMPDIAFSDTANYQFYNGRANPNQDSSKGPKSCTNPCHTSPSTGPMNPSWGGSLSDSYAFCKGCHGTYGPDVDYYGVFTYDNNKRPQINLNEWSSTGHGRPGGGSSKDPYANPYPTSQNPAANFENAPNPCWYCHDNTVLHTDSTNPFRLKKHDQFRSRFDKECVYCHMQGLDSECLGCHNVTATCSNISNNACTTSSDCGTGGTCSVESLAPQLKDIGPNKTYCKTTWADGSAATSPCVDHSGYTDGATSCTSSLCHYMTPTYQPDSNTPYSDFRRHNSGSGLWTSDQKSDVRNQYIWIGVCLKCHDDDNEGQCTSCHQAPASNPNKYALGYDGGMGQQYFVKALKAKASSFHFGYKHYNYFLNSPSGGSAKGWTRGVCSNTAYTNQSDCANNGGTWTATTDGSGHPSGTTRGGKFCWDCHDPHGDQNIYMIHNKPSGATSGGVSTSTDGVFGKPVTTADVSFTSKTQKGSYAKSTAPYNGICNVCHQTLYDTSGKILVEAKHWTNTSGDGHNDGKVCTSCHQHKFTDSHASGLECTTCHLNKPVPRHTGFSLPRDCTKCHIGIGKRIDVIGQMQGNSHHVQGVTLTNRHCYACHWEASSLGLIDPNYHLGYNFKTHTSTPGSVSDLVVWGPGARPTTYANGGSCSGTGVNCSSYNNQPACTAVTNCQWTPPSATTLANGGFCSGSGSCSSNATQATCLSPCAWTQLTAMTFNALFVGSDPTTAPSTSGYVCSDGNSSHNTQTSCTSSSSCSNSIYSTQSDCNAAYYGWVAGVWGTERDEVEKTTPHCLGCHSDQNKDTKAFSYCSIPVNPNTGSPYLTQYDSCSITGYNDQSSCQNAGGQWLTGCLNANNPYYCSKPGYHDQTSCQNAYYCSIAGYADQTHCQNAGGQWIHGTWSQPTWVSDCKIPRQYAWDRQSIASRYSQTGTTSWGKYVNVSHGIILSMDETLWNGTSGEVKDISPNGNNGTASNSTTVEWGRFERAGSFNGTNGYVTVPASSSLNITGPITISVWINLNALPSSTQTVLVGTGQYVIFVTSAREIIFRDNNGHGVTTSGANIAAGTWYHIAAVFSGTLNPVTAVSTSNTKIYINGTDMTASVSGSGNWSASTSNPTLYIGSSSGTSNFFNGLMDEVVIYSSALTATQIQTLAQGTVAFLGCDSGTCSTAQKNFAKAYSAHGNAKSNQGGWDTSTTTCSGRNVTSSACTTNGGTWSGTECLNLTQSKCVTTLGGSWASMRGLDGDLTGKNMRAATRNVQCFDCHSSHGSKLVGNTSSYSTTYGPQKCNSAVDSFKQCTSNADCSSGVSCTTVGQWGGNLKETVANRGGYVMDYTASYNSNTTGVNPYAAGAGQCFDCHETQNSVRPSCSGQGTCSTHTDQTSCQADINNCIWSGKGIPWGYNETFGVSYPIMGYRDTSRFGQGVKATHSRYTYRAGKNTIVGGHLHASSSLTTACSGTGVNCSSYTTQQTCNAITNCQWTPTPMNGLCTNCHDPHGVSPILGANQAYGVPLLKGTWLTSPYKEDAAQTDLGDATYHQIKYNTNPTPYVYNDRRTFGGSTRITETDSQFAGLCLNCHPKTGLTGGTNTTPWKSIDRIHGAVAGWGGNSEHSYPCSKCHQPHVSGQKRLMQTNCLDYKHRGRVISGGVVAGGGGSIHSGSFPRGDKGAGYYLNGVNCHPTGTWPDNSWNTKTPW